MLLECQDNSSIDCVIKHHLKTHPEQKAKLPHGVLFAGDYLLRKKHIKGPSVISPKKKKKNAGLYVKVISILYHGQNAVILSPNANYPFDPLHIYSGTSTIRDYVNECIKVLKAVLHISLVTRVGDTSQLPLACELLVQHFKLVDEFFTDRRENISGRDSAVGLDSNKELGNIRMSNLVSRHVDVGVHLEMLSEEVTESVVLLLQDEIGGVGHAGVHLLLNLLLTLTEEEELETIRRVHGCCLCIQVGSG